MHSIAFDAVGGPSQEGPPSLARTLMPFADESLLGLLLRLAEANILEGARSILGAAGLGGAPALSIADRDKLETLGYCLGLPIAELERRIVRGGTGRGDMVSFFGVTMRALHFTVSRRSIAPTALQEAPYHRAIWSISTLPYCSETWDFCHAICPGACGRPLDWEGWQGPVGCRHCGYDLRRAPVAKVPKSYRDAFGVLSSLVSPFEHRRQEAVEQMPKALQGLRYGELFDFALSLGRAAYASERVELASKQHRKWWEMAEGIRLLLDYPRSIEPFATAQRPNATRSPFFNYLSVAGYWDVFPALRAVVDDLLREFEPITHGPTRLKSQREERGDMSLSMAAADLQITKATMRTLANEGLFDVSPPRGSERRLEWFSQASVDAMAARLGNRQSAVEFSRSYGLPLAGVEQLVSLGLLAVNGDPAVKAIYDGLQLCRDDADAMIDRLHRRLRLISGPVWSLADVFNAIGDGDKPWGAILQSLLDGTLPIEIGTSPHGLKLDQLVVSQDSGRALIEGAFPELLSIPVRSPTLGLEPDMTRLEVERYLNCFPRDVSWLMANGRLGRPDGARRSVPRGDVVRLGHELISSREITWRWRVSPTLREALPEQGIHRAAGPFWPRRQVTDFFSSRFPSGRPS